MTIAMYPGSFDPPTNGHLEVIETASSLFEHVVVAIGVNPDKRPQFSLEERTRMLQVITYHLPNVTVIPYDGFTVSAARQFDVTAVVRGIRSVGDYEYERDIDRLHKRFAPDIHTVFLAPSAENSITSSSLVKGLQGRDPIWAEWVKEFLPARVMEKFAPSSYFRGACDDVVDRFRELWLDMLCMMFGNDEFALARNELEPYFTQVCKNYTHADRSFHALDHPANVMDVMMRVFFPVAESADDLRHKTAGERIIAVKQLVAAVFHDFIYDAMAPKTENENDSARSVADFVGYCFDIFGGKAPFLTPPRDMSCRELSRRWEADVMDMVLATIHDEDSEASEEARFVADCDIANFAFDNAYPLMSQSRRIRNEYAHLSEDVFWHGRGLFLRAFSRRTPIYRSQKFNQHFPDAEGTARGNMSMLASSILADHP